MEAINDRSENHLTPVGAFSASPGPYGTYDMGGDVYQWNESNKFKRNYREYAGWVIMASLGTCYGLSSTKKIRPC